MLGRSRGYDSSSENTVDRLLSCLLMEIDGIANKSPSHTHAQRPPVILLAATNRMEEVQVDCNSA